MSKINKSTDLIHFKEIKQNQSLSDLINKEDKTIFLKNNKKALACFEEFVRLQNKNKSRNNKKIELHLLNIKANPNMEKYKKNPALILKSYDKNLFDERRRKFKNKTLGVDEGYITMPINDNDENNIEAYNYKGNKTSRFNNNLNIDFDDESNYNLPKKNISNDLIFSAKGVSARNRKYVRITDFERGRELVSKKRKYLKIKSEQNYKIDMKKLKEDFNKQLDYNFELKKLNNWDYFNLQRNHNSSLNKSGNNYSKGKLTLINLNNLDDPDSSNMAWLLNIRNDKEKLKVVSRIHKLNEFFTSFGKEQDAIFMQTMKINKKGFMFDAFHKSKEELKDIKINENELISGVHFYREVIKAKIKREDMFKSEICECAEKLRITKIEKQENIIESYKLMNKLEELNKKEIDIFNEFNLNSNTARMFNSSKGKDKKEENKKINDMKKKSSIFLYKNKKENQNQGQSQSQNIDQKTIKKNKLLKLQMKNALILEKIDKIKKQKKEIEEKIKQNSIKLTEIQLRNKRAKANFTEKVQMLSEYYYQILKKGIDVRKNGLSWVVVKLMELNAYIDKNHFPPFLTDSEVSYLMRVGVKTFELSELVKLFQLLKIRQKKIREMHMKEDRDKENQIKEDNFNKIKEANKGNKYNIGNDYAEYMEEIQRKYEHVINICLNEKIEENDINEISQKYKKQILSMHKEEMDELASSRLYELYFIPGSLAHYFSKDKVFRQYFDDIFYLNEEINKRRKDLREEKEREYKKYRNLINLSNTNYFIQMISEKGKIPKRPRISEKDKLLAVLFGNDITV